MEYSPSGKGWKVVQIGAFTDLIYAGLRVSHEYGVRIFSYQKLKKLAS
jgi:hypothetical protein